jgi:methylmalonyl-CoA/ethylmalonyl-CoA epimerase
MTVATTKPLTHHLGYAVKDADAAAKRYTEALGAEFRLMPPYVIKNLQGEEAGLKVYYGAIAGMVIELIETTYGRSPHLDWLEEHGEGIQHLGLYVPDVVAATRDMIENKGGQIRWVYPAAGVVTLSVDSPVDDIVKETLPNSLTYLDLGQGGVIMELLGPPIHAGVYGGAVWGLEELFRLQPELVEQTSYGNR